MNSKTSRLFRQVKADTNSSVNALGVTLRKAWHAASSSRARGKVNAQLRAIVARQRAEHAAKMAEAERG